MALCDLGILAHWAMNLLFIIVPSSLILHQRMHNVQVMYVESSTCLNAQEKNGGTHVQIEAELVIFRRYLHRRGKRGEGRGRRHWGLDPWVVR